MFFHRKKTILFGFQNASPEGSPLQKMWTKEGTLKQRWILTLLLEILVPSISGELHWGIMSTFPLPMPVMHSAQVFPRPFVSVTRMPKFVPVPVEAPNSLSLFKVKRHFGISAIIVGLVATAAIAASVTASALALSATVQTTQTINDLSARVTSALDRQATANSQI